MVSFASRVLNFQPHILQGILRCTYRAVAIHISQLFFQRILAAFASQFVIKLKIREKIILMKVDQSL